MIWLVLFGDYRVYGKTKMLKVLQYDSAFGFI
jgi:hypothetical protein